MVSKPSSVRSARSSHEVEASESSPLIPRENAPAPQSSARRWSSLIALTALCSGVVAVLAFGFIAPAAAERYAHHSVALDLENISVDSFTNTGIRVRLTSKVRIDASHVQNPFLRTLGRAGARIVRKVHVDPSQLNIYLPDYDGKLLGTAEIPGLTVDIRNGHTTSLDIFSNAEPGSMDAIMLLLNKSLAGDLKELKVLGKAKVHLKTGIFGLGSRAVSSEVLLKDFPPLPAYKVGDLSVKERKFADQTVLTANVSVSMENPYSLQVSVPPLGFIVSLAGCEKGTVLKTAIASTPVIPIKPGNDLEVNVTAMVQSLPAELTEVCHQSKLSPMDNFLGTYLHGQDTIVYVSGSGAQLGDEDTPAWLIDFLESITVPVPFPGHALDGVIDSFGLKDVNIDLPSPIAEPGSPDSFPRLSATIEASIAIPDGMDMSLDIAGLRAMANVSYHADNFGILDLHRWIPAESEMLEKDGHQVLRVQGKVKNAPLNVTDYDVFQDLVSQILFGPGKTHLGISGDADLDVSTGLGSFIIREIPVQGNITLDLFPDLAAVPMPSAKDIRVGTSTPQSMNLDVTVSAENPTNWSAVIPYANFHVYDKDIKLGNATIENVAIRPGTNEFDVSIAWDPLGSGGEEAVKAGSDLIGKYVSGRNTTLSVRAHDHSFPSMPGFSKALKNLIIKLPTPRIGSGDSFIKYATMHIVTSTVEFFLSNPFPHDFITIINIDGEAFFNGSTLGTMHNNFSFKIFPGRSGGTMSPRLPVKWRVGSVGHEVVKKAVGGGLKVHAEADCSVRIGEMEMRIYYNASEPVDTRIRL